MRTSTHSQSPEFAIDSESDLAQAAPAPIHRKRNRVRSKPDHRSKKTHTFTISLHFDKRCSRAHALREARDCIHGEFYPTQRSNSEPGTMRVKTIQNGRSIKR